MARVREQGEKVRQFILNNVKQHSQDIARITAEHFGITRQAVNKHLQKLTSEGALSESGQTRNRQYKLSPWMHWDHIYSISPDLEEGYVWLNDIKPVIGQLPKNVMDIWQYGFTEMFNNAIDHSNGSRITVTLDKLAENIRMAIHDDGIGIFTKLRHLLHLADERHAILELSKGKLTTDVKRHSGEGIFFTSRMFDYFNIFSGQVWFRLKYGESEDWIKNLKNPYAGTVIFLQLDSHTARTTKKIFDEFTVGSDYGFNKTIVPVELARQESDNLISRSQAKRLLTRIEVFHTVIFNFENVEMIGQAFADEIFRVFAQAHPQMELLAINAGEDVQKMISRAKTAMVVNDTVR